MMFAKCWPMYYVVHNIEVGWVLSNKAFCFVFKLFPFWHGLFMYSVHDARICSVESIKALLCDMAWQQLMSWCPFILFFVAFENCCYCDIACSASVNEEASVGTWNIIHKEVKFCVSLYNIFYVVIVVIFLSLVFATDQLML